MTPTQTTWKWLERDPKSSYRQLSIKGHRIKARTLYGAFMSAEDPRTIEQIAEDRDLPVEAVREAITYCESDPPEIREDCEHEEAVMRAKGMLDPGYKSHGKPKILTPVERAQLKRR